MVNKKQPAAEKASKTSKPVSSVKKEKNQLNPKAQELFKDYYQRWKNLFGSAKNLWRDPWSPRFAKERFWWFYQYLS